MERTDELLDLGPSDRAIPSLGLKVDDIQPQPVLANNAVDPLITRLPNGLPCVGAGAPVTHLKQQLNDQLLEEVRGTILHSGQNLGRETGFHLGVCCLESLLGRLGVRSLWDRWSSRLPSLALRRAELYELRMLLEEFDVDPRGWGFEHFTTAVRDQEVTATGRQQQPALLQINLCLSDSVGESRLPPAGQALVLLGLRQLELKSKSCASIGKRVLLTISGDPKQREHQGLEIRDSHAHSSFNLSNDLRLTHGGRSSPFRISLR